MAKDPTTAREAMVAQMMEDFDAIVRRLEQVVLQRFPKRSVFNHRITE